MVYKSSSPTKDGRCWQFRVWYTDPNGTRKQFNSKKYETKKEAQKEEALYTLGLNTNSSTLKIGDVVKLFLDYLKPRIEKTTYTNYVISLNHFQQFFGLNPLDFGVPQYNTFISQSSSYRVSTLNTAIAIFKHMMNFANENLGINTTKQIKLLKPLKVKKQNTLKMYTFEQFEIIKAQSKYSDLFTILFYCGLRIGEARGLQWSDIDFETNTISISKQISSVASIYSPPTQTKTSYSIRTLPMFKQVYDCLKMRYNIVSQEKDFSNDWFVFGNTKTFSIVTIETELKQICESNNITYLGCHAFRHSCASHLLNHSASVYLVSKYLGHATVDITTKVYSHLLPNTLQDLVSFIENK